MKTFLKKLFQKLKTFTKEVGGNIKQGFFIGISFLGTVLVIGGVYAYTWIAPANVNTGDTLTATAWNNMVNDLNYLKDEITAISTGALLNSVYPIGSIYTSVSSTNPNTLFGGTWVAFGAGKVLVGRDASQTEFDVVEETGGEKTHILTITEMPSHTHNEPTTNGIGLSPGREVPGNPGTGYDYGDYYGPIPTSATGGGGAHNNLQPYIVVYMWKRTG